MLALHRLIGLSCCCLVALVACSNSGVGACHDSCQEGQRQCVTGGLSTCAVQSDGCLAFPAPVSCGAGLVCSGGSCSSSCTDQCTSGEKRCAGTEIEACAVQASGCTDWSRPSACSGGQACANDACPGCTDACTAGQTQCASSSSETTCQLGASGCWELVTSACVLGEVCSQDACGPVPTCSSCPSGYSCGAGGVCTSGDSNALRLDVHTVTVSGRVTLNGALPLTSSTCYQSAAFVGFYETTRGYQFTAPIPCHSTDFTFSQVLFPGTYRVAVSNGVNNDGANLPAADYVAADALVVVGDLADEVFNVRTFTVAGRVTLNGALPTASQTCYQNAAFVQFSETTHGTQFLAPIPCDTSDFTFSQVLFPGTYVVAILNGTNNDGANLPTVNAVVADGLGVSSNLANQLFNVRTLTVSGKVTLNGARPVASQNCYQDASFVGFYEPTHHYQFNAPIPCDTTDFSFSQVLLPGSYVVTVNNGVNNDGANLPLSEDVVINSLAVAGDLANQLLNVRTLAVSGKVTLNGARPVASQTCYQSAAFVSFYETTHGYQFQAPIACDTTDFSFNQVLFPGTYVVRVSNGVNNDGANLPAAEYVAVAALAVTGNLANQLLDIRTLAVSGNVTLNGALPVASNTCYLSAAIVSFYETTHGYRFSAPIACDTTDFSFHQVVFPGTYAVSVSNGVNNDGANLPLADYVARDALAVTGNLTNQHLDVRTVTVSGSVTLNGALPVVSNVCYQDAAFILFYETTHAYQFASPIACSTTDFTFSQTLFPGTYRISVNDGVNDDGANLPPADYVAVDAIALP